MNTDLLTTLAAQFAQALATPDLQTHLADHARRAARAQTLLTPERLPTLTEADLRELFFDSDAFNFWSNKEWELNNRLQTVGLAGIQRVLQELVGRGERGLTATDLRTLIDMRGLGTLLATELLAYRFPTRYWTYSANVTLPAFAALGDDVKATMPHGQRNDPYMYFALEPRLAQVQAALQAAAVPNLDYLVMDIFLWWVKTNPPSTPDPEVTPPSVTDPLPDVPAARIEQALRDFDQQKHAAGWADWEDNEKYKYALEWQGQHYPVKKIVSLATGVSTSNFISTQARAYLQERDFTVIAMREAPSPTLWLFQANPKIYDLETGLRRERFNDWQVTRYRSGYKIGDEIAFWKAGDRRGVYGLGKIISAPYQRADGDWVVDVEYLGRFAQPILAETLAQDPVLAGMLIFRVQQGTNFRLSAEEQAALRPLLANVIPPDADAIDGRENSSATGPHLLREGDVPLNPQSVLEMLVPDETARRAVLNTLADYIELAHSINPAAWELTLFPNRLRLNIGKMQVWVLHEQELYLVL